MYQAALLPTGSTAVTSSGPGAEVVAVAAAAVLLVILLLIKVKRGHDQKIRKAASAGYYDPDAARYGQGPVAPPAEGTAVDTAHLPLAPSFVAPGRATGTKRRTAAAPSPRPVPSSLGTLTTGPPRAVPAFDPVGALGARPAAGGGPAPTAATPPPSTPAPPRLDQPPPDSTPTDGRSSPGEP